MEYNQKALGERIYYYRTALNMSQSDVSKCTGLSKGYIGKLERGIGDSISIEALEKISKSLNVTPDDLLIDSLLVYQKPELTTKSKVEQEYETANSETKKLFHILVNEFLKYKENE